MNRGTAGRCQAGKKLVLAVCVLLALAEFSFRGPLRALHNRDFNDFLSPYMQTKAWLHGEDPYDPRMVAKFWPPGVVTSISLLPESLDGTLPAQHGIPSPYPVTAFPLLVPFALASWSVAILIWTGFNTIAFAVAVRCVLALACIERQSTQGVVVIAAALAFAPFHTAIAAANIVLVVVALGILAVLGAERGRNLSSGLLLAAAMALKPTVGLCFLVYCAARKKRRTIGFLLLGGAALFSIADFRMLLAGTHWLSSYLVNTTRMFAAGAIDDFTPANPTRFDLLNLQVVLFPLLGSKLWAGILSWIIVAGFLISWGVSWSRERMRRDGLLDLAILAALSLMPLYHRFPDAGLLLPAVVWAIREFARRQRPEAGAVLILAAPFLVPGAAVLQVYAASNPAASHLAETWWWQLLLAPHQVWLIAGITVLLLVGRRREPFGEGNEMQTIKARR